MFSEAQLNNLYRYGLSLTNEESLSYDLLQDALEKYLKMDVATRPTEGTEYFLRTIMRNRFIDQLRHRRRYPTKAWDEGDDNPISLTLPDPEDLLIDQQMLEFILARLDPLERELLYLWAYEELTAQEIATQLDTPRGTILSRIHRLRKKIAQLDLGMGEQAQKI